MVPILELRAGIPAGVAAGLNPWQAMLVAVAGNILPVPFALLFLRKILRTLRRTSSRLNRIIARYEQKTLTKAEKVRKYEALGLLLFVAVPLPGTGAWTGAVIASILEIRLKTAVPMILLGLLIAGVIVTSITYGASMVL
ncbi:COG2426 family protein [Eubacterium pyruvativorans]|nr:small multi-drug export protein [Eubacterium pyruvativorans]MDD7685223.1 small multi-drug export protein [Eubacterium pyruvativorans]MDY4048781.1 small multi-drug export protein [Eubacterium pyruvativorans]